MSAFNTSYTWMKRESPLAKVLPFQRHTSHPRVCPRTSSTTASVTASRRESTIRRADSSSKTALQSPLRVTLDNDSNPAYTVLSLEANTDKPGLLSAITVVFRDLGLDVVKATVEGDGTSLKDQFHVRKIGGGQISDEKDREEVVAALQLVFKARAERASRSSRPKFETLGQTASRQKRYTLMDTYKKNDVLSIEQDIVAHVEYTLARSRVDFSDFEAYQAAALSLRDRLIERWNDTQTYFREHDPKRVYYLSMEFLMGRSLLNTLCNLEIKEPYRDALAGLGYDLETLAEQERDAALGNGGLGRLAACFLDSMATLNLPAWGYGVRYTYGMFRQTIQNGFQHEQPDYWLTFGNPWEIERTVVSYPVKFYGHVSTHQEGGRQVFKWSAGETVSAIAYDNPIPGFGTRNCINLRLWAAKPAKEFDLEAFNTGDYVTAILSKQRAETLSSVLYPDDRTTEGKELRLKQQHFFVSATIQDVVRRYRSSHPDSWELFPERVALQLNDTHPSLAVPELMRILMDENGLGWTKSWALTNKVFAFTNHTVLPEALERWPVALMERLLPRHMQIVYDINWRFLQVVRAKYGDDWARLSRISIIEETSSGEKFVRMAYLAIVASHTVNGVARIHSDIIKTTIFADFADLWPERFQNKTNGVTQRRWLAFCNPPLRALITEALGGSEQWILDLTKLRGLAPLAEDPAFRSKWRQVKRQAKESAAMMIKNLTGVSVRPGALFDVQVKRIHEYKRQLLNLLGVVHRYDAIRRMSSEQRRDAVPRVCIFAGKAAPGYEMAKRIIKLVCAVADKVNSDPAVGDLLKVVFVPDYNVSSAEVLIPAAELSQHISTAGTEASGTSNMKFTMNGSLILGTLDGANVEIAEEIGNDNIFIFGATADEVPRLRAERRNYRPCLEFESAVQLIRAGAFGWDDYFRPVVEAITVGDFYLVANDFPAYLAAQDRVDEAYRDQEGWTRMSILAAAGSGKFSTDRTIAEYARDIWKLEECPVPEEEGEPAPKPASV